MARLERGDRLIANARAFLFFGGAAVAWWAWGWWGVLLALAFVALVIVHDRALTRRRLAERAVAHYQRGLDRLDGKWSGQGEPGERFREAAHPYAADLDLFGRGSLFELLCTARTAAGEDALAGFPRAPARRPRWCAPARRPPRSCAAASTCANSSTWWAPRCGASWSGPTSCRAGASGSSCSTREIGRCAAARFLLGGAALGLGAWWAAGGPAWPFLVAGGTVALLYRAAREAGAGHRRHLAGRARAGQCSVACWEFSSEEPLAAPRLASCRRR